MCEPQHWRRFQNKNLSKVVVCKSLNVISEQQWEYIENDTIDQVPSCILGEYSLFVYKMQKTDLSDTHVQPGTTHTQSHVILLGHMIMQELMSITMADFRQANVDGGVKLRIS